MLLKMTAGLSGPLFNLSPGDEYEFETAEAVRLIKAGFAIDREMAVKPAPIETRGKKTKPKAETEHVVSGESNDGGDGATRNA